MVPINGRSIAATQGRSAAPYGIKPAARPICKEAYEEERIDLSHPIFYGILQAEENLITEMYSYLIAKGIDLTTLLRLAYPAVSREFSWIKSIPVKSSYEDMRSEMLYLGYDRAVLLIDALEPA